MITLDYKEGGREGLSWSKNGIFKKKDHYSNYHKLSENIYISV